MFEQPVLPVCCRCVAVEHAHAKIPGGYSPPSASPHRCICTHTGAAAAADQMICGSSLGGVLQTFTAVERQTLLEFANKFAVPPVTPVGNELH